MIITDVRWHTLTIPLKKPFVIALGAMTEYVCVQVEITTKNGLTGRGEAPVSPRITGDTADSVQGALARYKPLLIGKDARRIGPLLSNLSRSLLHNSAARKAVDNALYDLFAQYCRMPLATLLGGVQQQTATSLTIGICDTSTAVQEAKQLISQGVKVIKVKIGGHPDQDIERVRALTRACSVPLRLDANQGYTYTQALRVLRALEGENVQFMEQPVKHHLKADMARLRGLTTIPIMADEGVHDLKDLLAYRDCCDMVNIKLAKCGGIHEALHMAAVLRAWNKPFMVGCMIETRLSIYSSLAFALGVGADYADLDGFVDLEEEGADTRVALRDGCLFSEE